QNELKYINNLPSCWGLRRSSANARTVSQRAETRPPDILRAIGALGNAWEDVFMTFASIQEANRWMNQAGSGCRPLGGVNFCAYLEVFSTTRHDRTATLVPDNHESVRASKCSWNKRSERYAWSTGRVPRVKGGSTPLRCKIERTPTTPLDSQLNKLLRDGKIAAPRGRFDVPLCLARRDTNVAKPIPLSGILLEMS